MSFLKALYEAPMLDGCSNIRFILTILMPLTKSGIGAMVVYTFINAWNMYMWPLLVKWLKRNEDSTDRYKYVK